VRCTCIRSRKPISAGRHCGSCGSLFLRIILQPRSRNRYTRYTYLCIRIYPAHDNYIIIIIHYDLVSFFVFYKNVLSAIYLLHFAAITTTTGRHHNPSAGCISCVIPITWLFCSTYSHTILLLLCHEIPSIPYSHVCIILLYSIA
jgi:hypothetical protein